MTTNEATALATRFQAGFTVADMRASDLRLIGAPDPFRGQRWIFALADEGRTRIIVDEMARKVFSDFGDASCIRF